MMAQNSGVMVQDSPCVTASTTRARSLSITLGGCSVTVATASANVIVDCFADILLRSVAQPERPLVIFR